MRHSDLVLLERRQKKAFVRKQRPIGCRCANKGKGRKKRSTLLFFFAFDVFCIAKIEKKVRKCPYSVSVVEYDGTYLLHSMAESPAPLPFFSFMLPFLLLPSSSLLVTFHLSSHLSTGLHERLLVATYGTKIENKRKVWGKRHQSVS